MVDHDAVIPQIRDGVFFTIPEAIPRGRHSLDRAEVQQRQRDRLLIATTELLAAHGAKAIGPADIAGRAGVSLAAFYECFESKEQCIFAGYDCFIGVLLGQLLAVDVDALTRAELVHALLGAYIDTLQSDLVVARAYQVEIDALGPIARERRRNSLRLFAHHLREVAERKQEDGLRPLALPDSAYIGIVYATRQLTSDELDLVADPDLSGLRADLATWLSDTFRDQ